MTATYIRTLGQVAANQQVVTIPLREAIEKYGEGQLVRVTYRDTPFGNFLLGWVVVGVSGSSPQD